MRTNRNIATTTPDGQTLVIDTRRDSYTSFFDHEWAKRAFGKVVDTKLDPLFFDLVTDWKGAACTARMPWLLLHSLESFHLGFTGHRETFGQKLIRAVRQHVVQRMGDSLSNMKRRQLSKVIDDLGSECERAAKEPQPKFPLDEMWRQYLQVPEFGLSLWSSQRLAYGAVYYAYENLLRRCVEVSTQKPYRARNVKEFIKNLNLVAKGLGDRCLKDPQVGLARLIRHALVHNGGRQTSEIANHAKSVTIVDGMIHIMPEDTKALYDLLKQHVIDLVERTLVLPAFKK